MLVIQGGPISCPTKCSEDVETRHGADLGRNTGMVLTVALNYGGRAEIDGRLQPTSSIALRTTTATGQRAGRRRNDLAISVYGWAAGSRSSDSHERGDARQQFSALWQIAYAEIYVTETLGQISTAPSSMKPCSIFKSAKGATAAWRKHAAAFWPE